MSSTIREKRSSNIIIENILSEAVTIPLNNIRILDSNEVFVELFEDIKIKPFSEFALEIYFRPLKFREQQIAYLEIVSEKLGILKYELNLNSQMDKEKKCLKFDCSIGEQSISKFDFLNFAKKNIVFNIKIKRIDNNSKGDESDFSVDSPNFNAIGLKEDNSGTKNTINIKFEPSYIGLSKALIYISSEDGGDYEVLLIGKGIEPSPKGPFEISSKGSTNLEFKNPAFEQKEFIFKFENPSFSSSMKGNIKIDSRKTISIPITFKPVSSNPDDHKGRFKITLNNENIDWIFFLKGNMN
jgi:hypothetical protein